MTALTDDQPPALANVTATEIDAAHLLEANENLVLGMIRAQADVETATRSISEITRLSELDPLTGLPNRVLLLDRFAQAIASAERHGSSIALLFIDLDRFKRINDALGHATGDRALQRVAKCLLSVVRKADTVSRHGGDEFLVLLTDVAQASDAALIAAKVISALAEAGHDADTDLRPTASIGISLYPVDGKDPHSLIAAADEAMYRAKWSGHGNFRFHHKEPLPLQAQQPSSTLRTHDASDRQLALRRPPLEQLHSELRDTNEQLLFAALRESDERERVEESLQLALEAAEMGSWEVNLETGKSRRSTRHDLIFGHGDPHSHWDVQAIVHRFMSEDREAVSEAFRKAETTGLFDFERRISRGSDESPRWLHMKGQVFHDDGKPTRIAGVVADVTDRRAVEEQLRQAQKMEAVGQLTGGIAHDFNNLLLVIGGSLELLARRLPGDERTTRLLQSARNGVAGGAKLNQQLLAFARRQDLKLESVSINTLCPDLEQLLQRAANETIAVTVDCAADAWLCLTDPNQLQVAILNLAINARDAMPNGGKLALTMRNRTVEHDYAASWGAASGDYLAIAVGDTGQGMSADVITRAFEPFFTTKAVGMGTGLGLSQVYGFAKQSGGFVSIESGSRGRGNVGSTVTIYLPRTLQARAEIAPPTLLADAPHARANIVLVVEDNAEVRAISCAMLEDLGYSVVEAETADAAIAMVERGDPVDVVFSDVIMPGMSGVDLVAEIRRLRPALPVLLTSGYTAQRTIPDECGGGLQLLRKPYSQARLSVAIREVIDAKRGTSQ